MGSIEWHERVAKKLSGSNLGLALFGKGLVVLALGTFYAKSLMVYAIPLLFLSVLLMLPTWFDSWTRGLQKKGLNYTYLLMDGFGKFALILLTGITFAGFLWPMRWGLVILGVLLVMPAYKEGLS